MLGFDDLNHVFKVISLFVLKMAKCLEPADGVLPNLHIYKTA